MVPVLVAVVAAVWLGLESASVTTSKDSLLAVSMSPLRRRWKPPAMAMATKTTRTEERSVADGSAENDVEAGDEAAALFFVLLPELDPFFELPDLFFLLPMAADLGW